MRYNAVTRRVDFANHTAETKGQYQFICLRQRKVTNMQLESATNKSNKSPEVFWLGFFCFFFISTHCDVQLGPEYSFQGSSAARGRTQTWNWFSLLLPTTCCWAPCLLIYLFYFLGKIIVADKDSPVRLNLEKGARHTLGFLPVNMELQPPVLVERRPHIHNVARGGSRGGGFKRN